MGLWPASAPTGYLKEKRTDRKCETYIDPERGHVIRQMFEKVAYEKWSGKKIYMWLKFDLNFRTALGKKHLSLGNIFKLLENHFYYGVFEYPKKSGNWYQGKHPPLITKELFDQVKTQLSGNALKNRREKEFAFTKLMTCGLCGSGISADEKYKKLKNGTTRAHVYYGCTRAKDKYCKCGYMPELNLVKQLQALVDKIEVNQMSVKKQIIAEVERYKKFEASLLGQEINFEVEDIDIKKYIKFLLKDGTIQEKREIMTCFQSGIILKQKEVGFASK